MKLCSKCQSQKEVEEFSTYHSRSGKPYKRNVCKKCYCEQVKKYHKARIRERKNYLLSRTYGTSLNVVEKMANEQQFKCLICCKSKKLVVDHDHKTGIMRGLLCSLCNRGLGHFLDDPKLLLQAYLYVLNSKPIDSASSGYLPVT